MPTSTNPARLRRDADRMLDLAARLDAGLGFGDAHGEDGTGIASLRARGVPLSPIDEAILQAAAAGGNGAATLRRMARARGERADLTSGFAGRLVYPAVLSLGVVAVALLVPGASSSGLPLLLAALGPMLLGAAVGLWAWCTRSASGGPIRALGWLRDLVTQLGEAPYLQAMAELYAAGVDLPRAHDLAQRTVPVRALRARLGLAGASLGQGLGYAEALDRAGALASEGRGQLAVAEESGTLEEGFARLARYRHERGQRMLAAGARVLGGVVYATAALAVLATAAGFYGGMYSRFRS